MIGDDLLREVFSTDDPEAQDEIIGDGKPFGNYELSEALRAPLLRAWMIGDDPSSMTLSTRDVVTRLRQLSMATTDQIFEDGVQDDFSTALRHLLEEDPSTVSVFVALRGRNEINDDQFSRGIKVIAQWASEVGAESHLDVLAQALRDPSARVRDAAAVAIASEQLQQLAAVLRDAISTEQHPAVRLSFQEALTDLSAA